MMKYLELFEKEKLDSSTPLNDSIETVFFFGKHDWNFIPFKAFFRDDWNMSFCDSQHQMKWHNFEACLVFFQVLLSLKTKQQKEPNTWKWVIRFKSNHFSSWARFTLFTHSFSLSWEGRREREGEREKKRWQKKGITQKVLSGRITQQGRKRQPFSLA